MPKDTKSALLTSAEKAARKLGFDGFSYADLAEDVGIRKASIHHHFPTKAALSVAMMQRYRATLADICDEIISSHQTGAGRLGALIHVYRSALGDGTSLCLCVALSISREHLSAEAVAEITAFRQEIITWLEDVFALGQRDGSIPNVTHPLIEARATLPLLEGAQLAARAQEDLAAFDSALTQLEGRISA